MSVVTWKDPEHLTLKRRLQIARVQSGLSPGQARIVLGFSVTGYEQGVPVPEERLLAMREAYDVSLNWIRTGESTMGLEDFRKLEESSLLGKDKQSVQGLLGTMDRGGD